MAVSYVVNEVLNLNWANEDGPNPIADYVFLTGIGNVNLPAVKKGASGTIWWLVNNGGETLEFFSGGESLLALPPATALCIQLSTVLLSPLECWRLVTTLSVPGVPKFNQLAQITSDGIGRSYRGKLEAVSQVEWVETDTVVDEFLSGKMYLFTAAVRMRLPTPAESSAGGFVYLKNGSLGSVIITTNSINTQFDAGDKELVLEPGDACSLMYTGLAPQPGSAQPKRFYVRTGRYGQQSNLIRESLITLPLSFTDLIPSSVKTGATPTNILTFKTKASVYAVVLNTGAASFSLYKWGSTNFYPITTIGTPNAPTELTTYTLVDGGPQFLSIISATSDTLSTYIFDGTTFAPVGDPIGTPANPRGLATFKDGDVTYLSFGASSVNKLITYYWSGTTFVDAENAPTVPGEPRALVSFKDNLSRFMAVTSKTDATISFYKWSTMKWADVGSTATTSGAQALHSFTVGSTNLMSAVCEGSKQLLTYRQSGANLTLMDSLDVVLSPTASTNYTYAGRGFTSVVGSAAEIRSYQWNGAGFQSLQITPIATPAAAVDSISVGTGVYVSTTSPSTNKLAVYQWLPHSLTIANTVPFTKLNASAIMYTIKGTPFLSCFSSDGFHGHGMLESFRWNGSGYVQDVPTTTGLSNITAYLAEFVSSDGSTNLIIADGLTPNGTVLRWTGSRFEILTTFPIVIGNFLRGMYRWYLAGVPYICLYGNTRYVYVYAWSEGAKTFNLVQSLDLGGGINGWAAAHYTMGAVPYLSVCCAQNGLIKSFQWNGAYFTDSSTFIVPVYQGGCNDPGPVVAWAQDGAQFLSFTTGNLSLGAPNMFTTIKWNPDIGNFEVVDRVNGDHRSYSVVSYLIGYTRYFCFSGQGASTSVGAVFTYKWNGLAMDLVEKTNPTGLIEELYTFVNGNEQFIGGLNSSQVVTYSFSGTVSLEKMSEIGTDVNPVGVTSYLVDGSLYFSVICKNSNRLNTFKWSSLGLSFIGYVGTDTAPGWVISYNIDGSKYVSITNSVANTMGTYLFSQDKLIKVGSFQQTGTTPQQLVSYVNEGVFYISTANSGSNTLSTFYWAGVDKGFLDAGLPASSSKTKLTGAATYYDSSTDTVYLYASSVRDATIETYKLAEPAFTLSGAPVSTRGVNPSAMVGHKINNETYLSLVNTGSNSLQTFKWNGVTAVPVGDLIQTGATPTSLSQYTADGIPSLSVVNSADGTFGTYRWNESHYAIESTTKVVGPQPFGVAAFTSPLAETLVSVTNSGDNTFATYSSNLLPQRTLSPDVASGEVLVFTDQDGAVPSAGEFTVYIPRSSPRVYLLKCVTKLPTTVVVVKFAEGAVDQSITINNQSGMVAIQVSGTGVVHRLFSPLGG